MKNKYEVRGDVSVIYIEKDGVQYEALIDTEDLEKVDNFYSNYLKLEKNLYPHGYVKRKQIFLYRYLMNCPEGNVVHHINHNPLDNRKSNLQITTTRLNVYLNKNRTNKYGHKFLKQRGNVWEVSFGLNKKFVYVGMYANKEEAIKVAKAVELTRFKVFEILEGVK